MHLLSSTSTALLGVLLAVTSFDNAWGHESRGLRGLMNDNGGDPSFSCGVAARTADEVKAFSDMVEQFKEEASSSPDGHRRLQEAIQVDVNFVIVKNTAGLGATEEQAQAQINVLNDEFRPDFVFKLITTQVVTNDIYFSNVTMHGEIERQMKTEYKRGGPETLGIYAVQTGGGWYGMLEGVVINFRSVPGGFNRMKGMVGTVLEKALLQMSVGIFLFSTNIALFLSTLISRLFSQLLVHEVGHWLGLAHTFEGGCDAPGDGIADTPAEAKEHYTCDNPTRDSCPNDPGFDPVYNHMSYSPEKCVNQFTRGQREAMRAYWFKWRAPKAAPSPPVAAPVPCLLECDANTYMEA
jgi:Pregnancy-associated plasma protein-A